MGSIPKTKLGRDKEIVAAADTQVIEVLRQAKYLAQRYPRIGSIK